MITICRDLNDRGIPTSTGKQWSPHTITRMLGAPRTSGERSHNGEIVAVAQWEGIISREDGARIRAILADPNRRANKSARRYLLVRLLKCWNYGEHLQAAPRAPRVHGEESTRRYGCRKGPCFSGCGKTFDHRQTAPLGGLSATGEGDRNQVPPSFGSSTG